MRELKFRFIDTGDGTVYKPITLKELCLRVEMPRKIILESENGDFVDTDDFLDLLEKDELIVEQYTGHEDKNGKEICEGDIVATGYKTRHQTDEDVFGEGHDEWDEEIRGKFEVKYSKRAAFGISHVKDPIVIRDLWELGSDIKVIGNIHKNPELLS